MARKRLIKFYKDGKRNYEVVLVLNQKLSIEALKQKIEDAKQIAVALGAEITHMANTSLKSYAYPIESTNNKKGYYACLYLSMNPANVAELNRKLSIQDDILRTFVILANPKKQSLGIFASNYEDDSYKPKRRMLSYDDPNALIKFLGERGRIEPMKQTLGRNVAPGLALRQRVLSKEIKRSRFLSLLPYIEE